MLVNRSTIRCWIRQSNYNLEVTDRGLKTIIECCILAYILLGENMKWVLLQEDCNLLFVGKNVKLCLRAMAEYNLIILTLGTRVCTVCFAPFVTMPPGKLPGCTLILWRLKLILYVDKTSVSSSQGRKSLLILNTNLFKLCRISTVGNAQITHTF
jgi:hypothetical protein